MDSRNFTNVLPAAELQKVFYLVIVMVCFAIPMVLIHTSRLSPIISDKRDFIYFGIAAIFCGAYYYVTNLKHFPASAMTTTMKVWYTTILLLAVKVLKDFRDLFILKRSELFLKSKVEELNSIQTLMLRQVDTRNSFNQLIRDIRRTTDRQRIMKSTIDGLGKILKLEECALWEPEINNTLRLSACLKGTIPIGSTEFMSLPVLAEIYGSAMPVRIPHTCPLVKATSICERCMKPDVVAIRVPLFHLSDTERYAVMVLVPPSDSIVKFRDDELELVGDVADQVAVALAHASAVEESVEARDHLQMENFSLGIASRNMEKAFHDAAVWRDGIYNQMLQLQEIIPYLSSFLSETTLTLEHRTIIEAVIKSSCSLESLMDNLSDLSRLEYGSLELSHRIIDLSATINQAVDKIKPIAVVKKLPLLLSISSDLPAYAIGDQERLMQIIHNILTNALKFTEEGDISVAVTVAEPRDWRSRNMVLSRNHFYLKVQIEDSGCGLDANQISHIFYRRMNRPHPPNQFASSGFGLPICKWLLIAMGGDVWVESEGLGKGTTVTFIVKLRKSSKGPSSGKAQKDPILA